MVEAPKIKQPVVKNRVGRPTNATIRAKVDAKVKAIAEAKTSYDSAPEPFSADDEGATITKRASSDKETPQKGKGKEKRRLHKVKVQALMERLTDEIVKPPGTPTPKKAITTTPESQSPKLAIEKPKITVFMLPSHEKPTPATKPKPKAKAKITTVKRKPAMVNQDEKPTKKQQSPSQVSIQVIRELFENAKNKKAITSTVDLEYFVWNRYYANKGN
jgi:hypothetical protein